MVSKELLVELGNIIEEDYGVTLTSEEVSEVGNTLLSYFGLLVEVAAGEGSES